MAWGLSWIPAFAGMTVMVWAGFYAQAAEMHIDPRACQQLTKYQPDPGVNYQPGVDVNGKKVAPADINSSNLGNIEDQMVIELNNNTAKAFGLNVPQVKTGKVLEPLANPEMIIGYITFENGKPLFNGKPLDNGQQDELAVLCMHKK